MKFNVNELLTYKALCERWDTSLVTVRKEVRRWRLSAVHFIGRSPLFHPKDVEKMEARRLRSRSKEIGLCLAKEDK